MKIFVDSASIQEIERFEKLGVVDGVTTNPSLLAKEKADPALQAERIVKAVKGPVSVEVVATDFEGIVSQGRRIAGMGSNVVVKVPMIPEGIRAVSLLSREGIMTNVTLIFSPAQALLAAKAGATYVSPFVGRLDDIGEHGLDLVRDIVLILRNYQMKTKVLAASIRNVNQVIECARLGADVVTLPPEVIDRMFMHSLTDAGLKKFLADWEGLERQLGKEINPFKR